MSEPLFRGLTRVGVAITRLVAANRTASAVGLPVPVGKIEGTPVNLKRLLKPGLPRRTVAARK